MDTPAPPSPPVVGPCGGPRLVPPLRQPACPMAAAAVAPFLRQAAFLEEEKDAPLLEKDGGFLQVCPRGHPPGCAGTPEPLRVVGGWSAPPSWLGGLDPDPHPVKYSGP